MKLTTKSEYSILALIYMARNDKNGFMKIEEICSKCDIPKKYLELLFMTLRQNGYIKTKRGTSGGYKFAKPASVINIAEIIRLMDGALAATESLTGSLPEAADRVSGQDVVHPHLPDPRNQGGTS